MAQAILSRVLDDIKILAPDELRQVEEAIRARMPGQHIAASTTISPEQIKAANALLRSTIVTLPNPTGADNDSIDADLAREYGDDHANLYQPGIEK